MERERERERERESHLMVHQSKNKEGRRKTFNEAIQPKTKQKLLPVQRSSTPAKVLLLFFRPPKTPRKY